MKFPGIILSDARIHRHGRLGDGHWLVRGKMGGKQTTRCGCSLSDGERLVLAELAELGGLDLAVSLAEFDLDLAAFATEENGGLARRQMFVDVEHGLGLGRWTVFEAWSLAGSIWVRTESTTSIVHIPWHGMSAHEILEAQEAVSSDARLCCSSFADDIFPTGNRK